MGQMTEETQVNNGLEHQAEEFSQTLHKKAKSWYVWIKVKDIWLDPEVSKSN